MGINTIAIEREEEPTNCSVESSILQIEIKSLFCRLAFSLVTYVRTCVSVCSDLKDD